MSGWIAVYFFVPALASLVWLISLGFLLAWVPPFLVPQVSAGLSLTAVVAYGAIRFMKLCLDRGFK